MPDGYGGIERGIAGIGLGIRNTINRSADKKRAAKIRSALDPELAAIIPDDLGSRELLSLVLSQRAAKTAAQEKEAERALKLQLAQIRAGGRGTGTRGTAGGGGGGFGRTATQEQSRQQGIQKTLQALQAGASNPEAAPELAALYGELPSIRGKQGRGGPGAKGKSDFINRVQQAIANLSAERREITGGGLLAGLDEDSAPRLRAIEGVLPTDSTGDILDALATAGAEVRQRRARGRRQSAGQAAQGVTGEIPAQGGGVLPFSPRLGQDRIRRGGNQLPAASVGGPQVALGRNAPATGGQFGDTGEPAITSELQPASNQIVSLVQTAMEQGADPGRVLQIIREGGYDEELGLSPEERINAFAEAIAILRGQAPDIDFDSLTAARTPPDVSQEAVAGIGNLGRLALGGAARAGEAIFEGGPIADFLGNLRQGMEGGGIDARNVSSLQAPLSQALGAAQQLEPGRFEQPISAGLRGLEGSGASLGRGFSTLGRELAPLLGALQGGGADFSQPQPGGAPNPAGPIGAGHGVELRGLAAPPELQAQGLGGARFPSDQQQPTPGDLQLLLQLIASLQGAGLGG